MLSTSPSSPISKLNDDVLLSIFMLNADMFSDDDALDTTRITSQVCRRWRTLTLASSSLWARLIDMDRISDSCSDEWRKEIIKRSGDALLWIQLSNFHPSLDIPEFFNFIAKNWHRIQKLVVYGDYPNVDFIPLPLKSPAPQLERFNVSIWRNVFGEDPAEAQPGALFGNHAPRLFDFHFDCHSVDHRAPWLSHLHYLYLDGEYFLQDLLGLLLEARNLEELFITPNIKGSTSSSSLPVISPPHLYSFGYYGSIQPCLLLLDHLKIPQDCVMSIGINRIYGYQLQAEEDAFRSVVAGFTLHVQRFLKSNPFRIVKLKYSKDVYIAFTGHHAFRSECSTTLSIPFPPARDDSLWLKTILDQLALLDFSGTTKLQFNTKDTLNPFFLLLFSRFTSLETICLDSASLTFLMRLEDEMMSQQETDAPGLPSVLFPRLEVIKFAILGPTETGCPAFEQVQVVVDYILSRERHGYPIHLLDMRDTLPFIREPNLDALEAVQDLRVLYICSRDGEKYEHTWSTYDT